jgi:hypothetical protein
MRGKRGLAISVAMARGIRPLQGASQGRVVMILFPPFPFEKGCLLDEKKYIVVYLDSVQARLVSSKTQSVCSSGLRALQSQTQEELDALLPSVLRPSGGAFKGELG